MEQFPTTWIPTTGTSAQVTPRVLRAQFGDGYMQAELDGLNAYLRKWQLTFEPMHAVSGTVPTLFDLNDFFQRNAGQRFQWIQPTPFNGENLKVFECTTWQWNYQQGKIVGLSATFEQRPET